MNLPQYEDTVCAGRAQRLSMNSIEWYGIFSHAGGGTAVLHSVIFPRRYKWSEVCAENGGGRLCSVPRRCAKSSHQVTWKAQRFPQDISTP